MRKPFSISLLLLFLFSIMLTWTTAAQAAHELILSNTSVLENVAIGTLVGTAYLPGGKDYHLDPDLALWPDNAAFAIDSSTGDLTTTQSFNVRTQSTYTIAIQTDKGNGKKNYEESFDITIIEVNQAPNIGQIAKHVLNENESAATLPLQVSPYHAGDALHITATSANGVVAVALSPDMQSLIVTPVTEASGSDTVTVSAYSSYAAEVSPTATMSFPVTVNFVKDAPPTIGEIDDVHVDINSGPHAVAFGGITWADADDTVAVKATSDNPALIPDPVVSYTSQTPAGTLTFTPAADTFGIAHITVTVIASEGTPDEGVAWTTFAITVIDKPVAKKQFLATKRDVPVAVTLPGTDPLGLPLSYAITGIPAHGTLSGTLPALTYTPAAGYIGVDSLIFTVDNGTTTSDPATVYITTVGPPAAIGNTITTTLNTPVNVTLIGTDPVAFPLAAYYLMSMPAHGTLTYADTGAPAAQGKLSGLPPALVYTPAPGFRGVDTFTFAVSNGFFQSKNATVSFTVFGVPNAIGNTVVTTLTSPVNFTLVGTDPLGLPITGYSIVTGPRHGVLTYTGTGLPASGALSSPALTYTPVAGFHDVDTFTFTVTNTAGLTSKAATVSFTVIGQPNGGFMTITTNQNTPVTYTLTGTDPLGLPLTGYTLTALPAHGTLTYAATGQPVALGLMAGLPPVLIYTPHPGFHDQDSFAFTVTNGYLTSTPAIVSITVFGRSNAYPKSVTTLNGSPAQITLTGTDPLGLTVTFSLASLPANGQLVDAVTGLPVGIGPLASPNLTYIPNPGYVGTDAFTYTVSNGHMVSNPATVNITAQ